MTNTPAMDAAERDQGKPLRQAILDLYAEHRDLDRVAKELGVSRHTIWNWRLRLQISDVELKLAVLSQKSNDSSATSNEEEA